MSHVEGIPFHFGGSGNKQKILKILWIIVTLKLTCLAKPSDAEKRPFIPNFISKILIAGYENVKT